MIMRTNTTPAWLFTHTEQLSTGQEVEIEYDREGDTLEILFTKGSGRGVALSEEIILRYDIQTNQPLSLIFIGFSHFMEQTPYGPESYRLTGLERLPNQEREQVLQILTSSPVDQYLHVSALALSAKQPKLAPIAYVRQPLLVAA
jgi:hypothetical protein